MDAKLAKILEWIDLSLNERPQLILGTCSETCASTCLKPYLAYEPSLDQAGHAAGPYSQRVNVILFVHSPVMTGSLLYRIP